MHYNENSNRAQAETDGKPRYDVYFPKAKKGEPAVRIVRTKVTFGKQSYSF